jgi:hypothetical protein
MTRDPMSAFMSDLLREYTQPKVPSDRKWEWWANGRRRSRTICIRLWPDSAELSIAHRSVGTNGCMSELNTFSCDVEHLPKLVHALNRALAVATERGLIKQSRK